MSSLSATFTFTLDPMKTICRRDLLRPNSCRNANCPDQHLPKPGEPSLSHALQVVDFVQSLVNMKDGEVEKKLVQCRINLYSGKPLDKTVSELISSLFPDSCNLPLHKKMLN